MGKHLDPSSVGQTPPVIVLPRRPAPLVELLLLEAPFPDFKPIAAVGSGGYLDGLRQRAAIVVLRQIAFERAERFLALFGYPDPTWRTRPQSLPVLRDLADLLDWPGTLAGLVETHDRGGVM